MGLQVVKGRPNNQILNLILKSKLDKAWIRFVLPGYQVHKNNRLRGLLHQIAIANHSITAVGYILAFAILYDSHDDAIQAMSITLEGTE
jgi:hypothetical protein